MIAKCANSKTIYSNRCVIDIECRIIAKCENSKTIRLFKCGRFDIYKYVIYK